MGEGQDWHILSAAVCNRCEDLYPKTDSIVLALHKGPEDGLRVTMLAGDIYKVKEVLGHKSVETTERYAHLTAESLVDSVGALERVSEVDVRLTQEKVTEGDFRKPA